VSDPILCFDEGATRKLSEMRDAQRFDGSALRVTVEEEGATFHYQIEVVREDAGKEADSVAECEGVRFFVDPGSAARLRGATLQYVDDLGGGGFRFENPNRPALLEDPLAGRVQQVLDDEINPGVAAHGGRVILVDVEDRNVFIRFGGGCQGCGMANVTLKEGVMGTLRRAIPEIAEVFDTTDHAAGSDPYFRA
jgi:Fe/S biogenesis protein NfuA